ncbi:MAG: methylenetetrahydrofolate--tRNA-(uracil(54)-C(5))-methyltransferase (FADH(2)-oxidizing) TrmFO [Blastocatellia bacterium]|nr:methylenetetrahydrofolate--tRNA-(uracil(54)-C(5))-methyltransferase (FADH(2)-oxidizing) TrmFO [Blastocatellia bacterium]MBL8194299.1 methylenetetrahydrofolate--tRNA-(uracil(54)-C(5))-methyltransferase (FADH(2)-oxidizing) TrmFO [Blastocatellia bacterium]MBN8724122.1 methylenetetrahydrofolate--tRNA-(uracil(54)-C(5))-methyltransferase (FADH(2)-oxidizing) TrmFO [Acidobacteriota bacterium]
MNHDLTVIGGGLAGSEAAWQAARFGLKVKLYEMRPEMPTPAHKTDKLAEIVCSNSLKSDEVGTAPYLLKEELRRAGSLLLQVANRCRVPAGAALAVDREIFSSEVTREIEANPNIDLIRSEMPVIADQGQVIIASGPLTSKSLSEAISKLTGTEHLYFYDAISPVVDAETINYDKVFRAARYDKGDKDYINCPMTAEEYQEFYQALITAESVATKDFEKAMYFEGCLPIEELARRGRDTLRFGPMKPVGLIDPKTGRIAYAAVQLRQENLMADSYNLVGFQNHLKFGEQKKVLQLIPGLEQAEFIKYGQIHRNTYINAPDLLNEFLQVKKDPRIYFAGQISGVEGYVESIATGLVAGITAAKVAKNLNPIAVPRLSAIGSLLNYVANCEVRPYQPANITFALLPALDSELRRKIKQKAERKHLQVKMALTAFDDWLKQVFPA